MAASDQASGTLTIASITSGRKDASTRGRPMPSIREPQSGVRPRSPVIEASSGSTAISEAYFARLLGLPFIAVMPASTSKEKIAQIAFYGGQSHLAGRRRMHYRLADVGPRRIGTLRLVMGEILGATEAGEPQQPIVALGQDGTYLAVGDGSQMRTNGSAG